MLEFYVFRVLHSIRFNRAKAMTIMEMTNKIVIPNGMSNDESNAGESSVAWEISPEGVHS